MESVLFIANIFIIIAMTAVSLITVMLAIKNKGDINKSMRNLSIFLLLHLVFSFLINDFGQESANEAFLMILTLISDAFYFCFVASWVNLIGAFGAFLGHRKVIVRKRNNLIIAGFAAASEVLLLLTGTFNPRDGELYFDFPWAQTAMEVMNVAFALLIISVSAASAVIAVQVKEKGIHRTGELFFAGLLIPYMMWILVFDYAAVNHMQYNLLSVVGMDPIFIICFILDIAVLVFFFRKYPVEGILEDSAKNRGGDVKSFAEEAGLTKRETEVLGCVCSGMNNPEIAEALFISGNTVKRHLNNIFQKTGVKNRYDLISKVLDR